VGAIKVNRGNGVGGEIEGPGGNQKTNERSISGVGEKKSPRDQGVFRN